MALAIQITRLSYRLLQSIAVVREFSHMVSPAIQDAVTGLNKLQDWLDLPYEPDWEEVAIRSSDLSVMHAASCDFS